MYIIFNIRFLGKVFPPSLVFLVFALFFTGANHAQAAAPSVTSAVLQNITSNSVDVYLTGTAFSSFVHNNPSYNADSTDLAKITYFNGQHPTSATIVEDGTTKHLTATFAVPPAGRVKLGDNFTIAAGTIRNGTTQNSLITILDSTITNNIPSSITITNVTSASSNGVYKEGASIDITVQFSEAVSVTGSPFLGLNTGATANYSSGSGTNTLTFNYIGNSASDTNDLDVMYISLNGGGTIKDTATGTVNADISGCMSGAGCSLSANKDISIDNTAPTLISAEIVSSQYVKFTFSEPVTGDASANITNFGGILAGHFIQFQTTLGTNTYAIAMDSPDINTGADGSVDISTGLVDAAGNAFAGVTNYTVTGGTLPYLMSTLWNDIDHSGTFSGGDTITLKFNNSMVTNSALNVNNADAPLGLSNGHTFGTIGGGLAFDWSNSNKTLAITLGSDNTLSSGDTIDPTTDVIDVNSAPDATSAPLTLSTNVWYGEYWNFGSGPSPEFDFNSPGNPVFTNNISGGNLAVDWADGSPDNSVASDHFIGRFTKTINITQEGDYNFALSSDDGVELLIDGGMALSAWGEGYNGTPQVHLTVGNHTIVVHYYENGGGANIFVSYSLVGGGAPNDVYVDDDYTSESAGGHTWGVDAFNNIPDAMNAANSGGTVHVNSGAYDGSFDITKPLTLIGSMPEDESTVGPGVDAPVLSTSSCNSIWLQENNITFKGFIVSKESTCEPTIAVDSDYHDALITHNEVIGGQQGIILRYDSYGNTVSYNKVHDTGDTGIRLPGSHDNIVSYNETYGNQSSGITLAQGNGGAALDTNNNTISHNDIHDNGDYGIFTSTGNTNTISNNNVYHNGYTNMGDWSGGIFISDDFRTPEDNVISNNNVHENYKHGIAILSGSNPQEGHGNIISGNSVTQNGITFTPNGGGPGAAGILVNASYTDVTGNTVAANNASGIRVGAQYFSPTSVTITNNNIGAASVGEVGYNGNTSWGVYVYGFGDVAPEIHNNNITGNGYGVYNNTTTVISAINNWWGDVNGPHQASTNVSAIGDEVSDYVMYDPHLSVPAEFNSIYVDDDYTSESAGGHTWGVDAFDNLHDAIAASTSGTIIHVAGGTYNYSNEIIVNKSITIEGPGLETGDPARIVDSGCPYALTIDASHVTISGLIIDATNNCGAPAVRILGEPNNSSHTAIDHVTITGNEIMGGAKALILRGDSSYNTITNNIIHNSYIGISIRSSKHNTITGNTIYSTQTGIEFQSGDCGMYCDGHPDYNTISTNIVHDNDRYGIYVNRGNNNSIESNTVYGNGFNGGGSSGGIFFDGNDMQDNQVNANMVYGNYKHGIAMQIWSGVTEGHGNIINGNTIFDNGLTASSGPWGPSGIEVIGDYTQVTNNLISHNRRNGIQIGGDSTANYVTVTGNTIGSTIIMGSGTLSESCTDDLCPGNTERGILIQNGIGHVIHNNIISGNIIGIFNRGGNAVDASDNYWGSETGPTAFSNPSGTGDSINSENSQLDNPYTGGTSTNTALLISTLQNIDRNVTYRPYFSDNGFSNSVTDSETPSVYSERGFNYGETTDYGHTVSETSESSFNTETFSLNATEGLVCGTQYHMRAYVISNFGTMYSPDGTFSTQACNGASVSTGQASNITKTTATISGDVTSMGEVSYGEYGVVFGLHGSSLGDESNSAVISSETFPIPTGEFSVNISSGLACGVQYDYKVFLGTEGPRLYSDNTETFTTANCGQLVNYRYVKWEITKKNGTAQEYYCGGNSCVQAGEFKLLANNEDVSWPEGTIATNPNGENPFNEPPSKLIDGDPTLKTTDSNFSIGNDSTNTGDTVFVIDTGSGNSVLFNGYKWATGTDYVGERDPMDWQIFGSNDGETWTLLDTRTGEVVTADRSAYTSTYGLEQAPTDELTEVPVLSSPSSSSSYSRSNSLSVSFNLPETPLHNSILLTFTPSSGSPVVMHLRDAAPQQLNTFSLPLTGGISSVNEVISSTSESIPAGVYSVTLSYQDVNSNTAATATSSNVIISEVASTPVVVRGGGGGGGSYLSLTTTQGGNFSNSNQNNNSSDGKGSGAIYHFPRTLKPNMKGDDVLRLQKFLNAHGFIISKTGPGSKDHETNLYGPKLKQALIKYQKANGLKADGVFGPKTRKLVESQMNS